MRHTSILTALLLSLLGQSGLATAANGANNTNLRMATWNLEWLIAPREFRELAASCLPRNASPGNRDRYIPCNVADELQRSEADFRALRSVAEEHAYRSQELVEIYGRTTLLKPPIPDRIAFQQAEGFGQPVQLVRSAGGREVSEIFDSYLSALLRKANSRG